MPHRSVIDASAALAMLFGETGAETVAESVAQGAAISAVNISEIAEILRRRGLAVDDVLDLLIAQVSVEPFTLPDAISAAEMAPATRDRGISLADRCCLALARRLGLPVITADQVWASVELGIDIQLIRNG